MKIKSTQYSSSTTSMGDEFQDPSGYLKLWLISNPIYTMFLHRYRSFYSQEALYGFSLAYSNCQHHCSGALGSLLSKISVIERKHCDTVPANLINKVATE